MSNLIKRDKKKRILVEQLEAKRLAYISIRNNMEISPQIRYELMQKLNQLPRNSSKVRVKNRCILTGRGGSVSRLFKLSRIKIRELAGKGSLPGVTKSSW